MHDPVFGHIKMLAIEESASLATTDTQMKTLKLSVFHVLIFCIQAFLAFPFSAFCLMPFFQEPRQSLPVLNRSTQIGETLFN